MRWSGLLAAASGALVLAAAQGEDTTPGIGLLDTLTKGVPAADLTGAHGGGGDGGRARVRAVGGGRRQRLPRPLWRGRARA